MRCAFRVECHAESGQDTFPNVGGRVSAPLGVGYLGVYLQLAPFQDWDSPQDGGLAVVLFVNDYALLRPV